MRKPLQLTALAASLALVFGLTLTPADARNHVVLEPWKAQQFTVLNVVGNVALFALPSALLWSLGWPLRRTIVSGFVVSLAIELLQLTIRGRTTATLDVLCNTLGAGLGWLLARAFAERLRVDDYGRRD